MVKLVSLSQVVFRKDTVPQVGTAKGVFESLQDCVRVWFGFFFLCEFGLMNDVRSSGLLD